MNYAIGRNPGAVRLFITAPNEAEAVHQANDGEGAFRFDGVPRTGGLIQDGVVVFPTPSAAALVEQAWQRVREQRNALLDRWRWTVQPDSPVTTDCKAAFLTFLQTLNRVTVDFTQPGDVRWPSPPALSYPPPS